MDARPRRSQCTDLSGEAAAVLAAFLSPGTTETAMRALAGSVRMGHSGKPVALVRVWPMGAGSPARAKPREARAVSSTWARSSGVRRTTVRPGSAGWV